MKRYAEKRKEYNVDKTLDEYYNDIYYVYYGNTTPLKLESGYSSYSDINQLYGITNNVNVFTIRINPDNIDKFIEVMGNLNIIFIGDIKNYVTVKEEYWKTKGSVTDYYNHIIKLFPYMSFVDLSNIIINPNIIINNEGIKKKEIIYKKIHHVFSIEGVSGNIFDYDVGTQAEFIDTYVLKEYNPGIYLIKYVITIILFIIALVFTDLIFVYIALYVITYVLLHFDEHYNKEPIPCKLLISLTSFYYYPVYFIIKKFF